MPETTMIPCRPPVDCKPRSITRGGFFAALIFLTAMSILILSPAVGAAGFEDTKNHWAEPAIDLMNAKGLVKGSGSKFEPNRAMTRYEAITMLVRVLGLEEVAANRSTIPASFKEGASVPSWAKGYVGEAVDRGIIADEELKVFGGGGNALRVQVAAWLARALDLREEAAQAAAPSFSDTGTVSAGYRGYLTVLAEREIMNGDNGNKFRPFDVVTRAEMAVLLERVDRLLDNDVDKLELRGTVESTAGGLTLKLAGGATRTLTLANDIRVYFDGKKINAAPGFIVEGDEVMVLTDAGGRAAYIAVSTQSIRVTGTIKAVETGANRAIEVEKSGGAHQRYPVAAGALVVLDGRAAPFQKLKAGQQVTLEGEAKGVTRIIATGQSTERRGEVTSIAFTQGNAILGVKFQTATGETENKVYTIATNFAVTKDGLPARVYDITEKDRVTVKQREDRVMALAVESYKRTVRGTLREVLHGVPSKLTIGNDQGQTYPVAPGAAIKKDGETVGLVSLRVGDAVEAEITGDEITSVVATTQSAQLEGVITRIILADPNEITVRESDGKERTYKLAPDATVKLGSNYVSLLSLKRGNYVKLTIASDQVTAIRSSAQTSQDDLRGTVRSIDSGPSTFVLEPASGGGLRHVKADSGFFRLFRSGQLRDSLSTLAINDIVIVVGKDVPGSPFTASIVIVVGTSVE